MKSKVSRKISLLFLCYFIVRRESVFMYNQPYQQQFRPASPITWVQGIEGAKAIQIMPNSSTILLDSENDGTMYIKTSDNIGMCNLRRFTYTEVLERPKNDNIDYSKFVTRDELEQLLNDMLGGKHE